MSFTRCCPSLPAPDAWTSEEKEAHEAVDEAEEKAFPQAHGLDNSEYDTNDAGSYCAEHQAEDSRARVPLQGVATWARVRRQPRPIDQMLARQEGSRVTERAGCADLGRSG